ncbi:MAG: amino acid ABC transporter permease [Actinobacteria bacterium]|nr:amino acid ABC transporter permease [Actinomycetota bacterium]
MGLVLDNLSLYGEGLRTTVALTLLSFVAAFAIGVVIAAFRVSPVPPLRAVGTAYVETIRNTPLPVLLVLFFFGFPKIGIRYSTFASAVIVLSVYTGAFIAETVRSGINTVAAGQGEAARAIGLTFPQTLSLVVLPQALRSVVAPIGNLFIALTKNSSVAFLISTLELTGVAERLTTQSARPVAAFVGAGAAYLLLTIPAGLAFGALERRVAVKR